MNRIQELKNLLEIYINKSKKMNSWIPWSSTKDLTEKLVIYKNEKLTTVQTNEDWFNAEIVNGKSEAGEIFEKLNSKDDELNSIAIRLRNLIANKSGNQISNSNAHYQALLRDAKPKLRKMGYEIVESKGNNEFHKSKNQVELKIMYQRYDPPEVWIKRKQEENYVRIDALLERYIFGNYETWKKHSGENGLYFNYSKFNYYEEVLNTIEEKLANDNNFNEKYETWVKENM